VAGCEPAPGRELVFAIYGLQSSTASPRPRGGENPRASPSQSGRRFDLLPQPNPWASPGTADELDACFLEDLAQPPDDVGTARRDVVAGLEATRCLRA
jgi:hypothetical protein